MENSASDLARLENAAHVAARGFTVPPQTPAPVGLWHNDQSGGDVHLRKGQLVGPIEAPTQKNMFYSSRGFRLLSHSRWISRMRSLSVAIARTVAVHDIRPLMAVDAQLCRWREAGVLLADDHRGLRTFRELWRRPRNGLQASGIGCLPPRVLVSETHY